MMRAGLSATSATIIRFGRGNNFLNKFVSEMWRDML